MSVTAVTGLAEMEDDEMAWWFLARELGKANGATNEERRKAHSSCICGRGATAECCRISCRQR